MRSHDIMKKLRAVHYAILRNPRYDIVVLAAVSEAIATKRGHFHHGRFKLKSTTGLNRYEKQILTKITTGTNSRFHYMDYYNWIQSLLQDCISLKLLRKWPLLGFRRTFKANKAIHVLQSDIDPRIAEFIETSDGNQLKPIDSRLPTIVLPSLKTPNKNHGPDSLAQANDAIKKGCGFANLLG